MTKNKFKNRFMEDLRNDLYDGIMRKGTGDFHGPRCLEGASR